MASKGSPSRKMCWPSSNGPTCATSMCSSSSRDLSKPCARQVAENAQVLQKRKASPSSAMGLVPERGRVMPAMRPHASSDGAGMTRPRVGVGLGMEVSIETHRDDTQHQTAARGRDDSSAFQRHQAIPDERLQPDHGLGEIEVEVEVVARFDLGTVDGAATHELLDDFGAHDIVVIHQHAARQRKAALVDGNFPLDKLAEVLAVAFSDVADGACTEPDEIALRVRGIAHEIAMQGAGGHGDAEIVVGQREMIEADVLVAC